MAKRYKGRKPRTKGWAPIASIGGEPNWLVYVRQGSGGWSSIKVFADGSAERKANYWLGWNGERFADHPDVARLAEREGEILKRLEDVLREQDALDLL